MYTKYPQIFQPTPTLPPTHTHNLQKKTHTHTHSFFYPHKFTHTHTHKLACCVGPTPTNSFIPTIATLVPAVVVEIIRSSSTVTAAVVLVVEVAE